MVEEILVVNILAVDAKGLLRLVAVYGIRTFVVRTEVKSVYSATCYLEKDQTIDQTGVQVESIPELFARYSLVVAIKIWLFFLLRAGRAVLENVFLERTQSLFLVRLEKGFKEEVVKSIHYY